jgi:hypothetical protein
VILGLVLLCSFVQSVPLQLSRRSQHRSIRVLCGGDIRSAGGALSRPVSAVVSLGRCKVEKLNSQVKARAKIHRKRCPGQALIHRWQTDRFLRGLLSNQRQRLPGCLNPARPIFLSDSPKTQRPGELSRNELPTP